MSQSAGKSHQQVEGIQLEFFRTEIQAGMDQAAEMLSRFLEPGFNFRIQLTNEEKSPPVKIPDFQPNSLAGVCLEIEGAIAGNILLLFSAEKACQLAGLLLREEPPADLKGDPLRSTLKEIGNIFASGILFSLDDRMKLRAMPSPPVFLSGTRQQVEKKCQTCNQQHDAILVEARLECDSPKGSLIEGTVLFRVAEEALIQVTAAGKLTDTNPSISS